jgi:hypothetical protein
MVYGTQITIVTGANQKQLSHHNGGPHIASSQDRITGAKSSAFLTFLGCHVVTCHGQNKVHAMGQWVILPIMGILIKIIKKSSPMEK